MAERKPNLPGLFDLVVVEKTDSSRAYAERLARRGAGEGTLVWAKSQNEGIGCNGRYWMSGNRNMHCSIILRPDMDLSTCCELGLVACICAALAISAQAEPMEELRYGWPNDVLLNRGKIAGVALSGQLQGASVKWMVIALNANVYDAPESRGMAAASMRGEGFRSHDRVALLEAYSRQFLSWTNRWADEGMAPIAREWRNRGPRKDDPVRVRMEKREVNGSFLQMMDHGGIELVSSSKHTSIDPADFFRSDFVGQSTT